MPRRQLRGVARSERVQAMPSWSLLRRGQRAGAAVRCGQPRRPRQPDVAGRLLRLSGWLLLHQWRQRGRAMRRGPIRRRSQSDERAVRGAVRCGPLVRGRQHERYRGGVRQRPLQSVSGRRERRAFLQRCSDALRAEGFGGFCRICDAPAMSEDGHLCAYCGADLEDSDEGGPIKAAATRPHTGDSR